MNVITLPVQHKPLAQQPVGREKEGVGSQELGVRSEEESPKSKVQSLEPRAQILLTPNPQPPTPHLVSREAELTHLHTLFAKALHGERQIVFVTGEAGIGKTTLVDAFLGQLREGTDVHLTSGQCVELYGPGEAYMPLMEATMQLCRGPDREQVVTTLERYAPSWLVQLPGLLDSEDRTLLQQRVQGTSPERMLREMAEVAEQFSTQHGFVVVLEDLHWSDVSTLEWVSYIAQRHEPARLLIIGTYRPTDTLNGSHPLRGMVQELIARNRCSEIRIAPFAETGVADYLQSRFAVEKIGRSPLQELVPLLYRRTAGNPLFVVNVVDDLCQQGIVHEEAGQWRVRGDQISITQSVPDNLRHVIERQVERLPLGIQQLLEVASVVGVEFSAAAVAAGLLATVEEIDHQCQQLARQGQFIHAHGIEEWPDNTLSERYSFHHALYQTVLAERVNETQKIRVHRQVGERKALAYGERVGEIAAELAVHFEKGRNFPRAVYYLGKAGDTAMQRNAHHEAIAHLTRGLALLSTFADTPDRKQQELTLQVALGALLLMTKGYAAPEVAHAYGRARDLCQQIGEQPDLFPTLVGLSSYYLVQAELPTARELTAQCVRLAEHAQDPALLAAAYFTHGVTLFYQGELTAAQATLAQGSQFYNSQASGSLGVRYGQDPGVACHGYGALASWLLGYPDQALAKSHDALTLARQLSHSYSVGFALHTAGWLHQYRQDRQQLQEHAEEVMRLSREEGFALWFAVGMILRGWVLSEHGEEEQGLALMREGLPTFSATGAKLAQPYHIALLAQAYGKSGQPHEGLVLLDQALAAVTTTGERYYEAEFNRLRGELTLAGSRGWGLGAGEENRSKSSVQSLASENPSTQHRAPSTHVEVEAEACFRKAIEIARQQHAKSLELRAAVSLARLWQQQNNVHEACDLLQEIYDWFTEGFDTKDLHEAEALLVTLGGNVSTREERQKSKGKNQKAKIEIEDHEHEHTEEEETRRQKDNNLISQSPILPVAHSLSHSVDESCLPTSDLGRGTSDAVFRAEGDYWKVSFAGTTCQFKDARGLHYIAYLLQQPHQEIHVIALVTSSVDLSAELADGPSFHDPSQPVDHTESFSDAGEILDPQARAAYKQRLSELREELAEAKRFQDLGRSEQLTAEIDFLTHELTSAVGLGGRMRQAYSPVERARIAVTKAVKTVLKKIHTHHPALGQHLAITIKTGAYCSYTPDPRLPISWQG